MDRLRFACPHCQHALSAPVELAGRELPCPSCRYPVNVPEAGEPKSQGAAPGNAAVASPRGTARRAADSDGPWYLRVATGELLGPVDRPVLDQWMREGRISEQSELRAEAWTHWCPAREVYPQLRVATKTQAVPPPAIPSAGASGDDGSPVDWPALLGKGHTGSFHASQAWDGSASLPRQVCAPLLDARPWMKLTAAFCFVIAFELLLGSINFLASANRMHPQIPSASVGLVVGICLAMAFLHTVIGIVVLTCSRSVSALARTSTIGTLAKALDAQKAFWRLTGLIGLVLLCIQGLFLILAFVSVLAR